MRKIARIAVFSVALFMRVVSMAKAFVKVENNWYYNSTSTLPSAILNADNWGNSDAFSGCGSGTVRPCHLFVDAPTRSELQTLLNDYEGDIDGLIDVAGARP